jgi:Spy/CpxP family protein refolding chaperone
MEMKRILERWAAAAGLCVLWAAVPGAAGAQEQPPAPAGPPHRHMDIVPDSKLKHADPMDDFSGVDFTVEQKGRVEKIREDSRSRMHDVAVDTKLSPEQRAAMIEGIQRLERGQVYQVLTPEQKDAVRKRILARRQAAQKDRARQAQARPTPLQPLPH